MRLMLGHKLKSTFSRANTLPLMAKVSKQVSKSMTVGIKILSTSSRHFALGLEWWLESHRCTLSKAAKSRRFSGC